VASLHVRLSIHLASFVTESLWIQDLEKNAAATSRRCVTSAIWISDWLSRLIIHKPISDGTNICELSFVLVMDDLSTSFELWPTYQVMGVGISCKITVIFLTMVKSFVAQISWSWSSHYLTPSYERYRAICILNFMYCAKIKQIITVYFCRLYHLNFL